jgi:hypothetical protein
MPNSPPVSYALALPCLITMNVTVMLVAMPNAQSDKIERKTHARTMNYCMYIICNLLSALVAARVSEK